MSRNRHGKRDSRHYFEWMEYASEDLDAALQLFEGGTCLNLTDLGCRLDFEDRPYECRLLDPKDCLNGGYTGEPYTKRDIADKWEDYADIIFEIIDELKLNVGCGRYLGYGKEPKVLAEVKSWLDSYPQLDVHGVRYMRDSSQPEIHSEGLTSFLPCEWLQL